MKTIKNTVTKIKGLEDEFMTYGELLKIVANEPPEKGLKVEEMRERFRILDAIENCGSADINLEDADFNKLKSIYTNFAWLTTHKDLIALADHLDELAKTT